MSNVINIDAAAEEPVIIIERASSEEFIKAAHALGDWIKNLPLNHEQNDTLIYLITGQVEAAERNAFRQGFDMGVKLGEWRAEQ